ncbi:MAG: hypothetical protein LUG91_07045 [Ruminococcus sp.]|nr:hypothetical protein [Ruminococcus sp.]
MTEKTVIFFGAGATASCGFPTTETQNGIFRTLFLEDENSFRSYAAKKLNKLTAADLDKIVALRNKEEMKQLADFLKFYFSPQGFKVQQMYHLIDSAISENRSLRHYTVEEIKDIRKSIIRFLQVLFSTIEAEILKKNGKDYRELKRFFQTIAEIQLKKRLQQYNDVNLRSEDFIFTDVSYVSFNWDVLVLWAMMTAHKELNDSNSNYMPDPHGISKLKVFNDYFTYLNSYDTDLSSNKQGNSDWFPYNRTVAYRVNDREHDSDKRVILFPTFFPHGQTHWLECPKCRKMTMYIDKAFRTYSDGFPMEDERKYVCSNCRNDENLTLENSAMLLQTNDKIKPSYIEEIQNAMRININQADNFVFIGYSLPEDDMEYQSILRIAKVEKSKKVFLVLYQDNSPNVFLVSSQAKKKANEENRGIIERFCGIFSEDSVWVNLAGFPAAFDEIIKIIE